MSFAVPYTSFWGYFPSGSQNCHVRVVIGKTKEYDLLSPEHFIVNLGKHFGSCHLLGKDFYPGGQSCVIMMR